jgi:hypothetical protein
MSDIARSAANRTALSERSGKRAAEVTLPR